MEEEEEEEGGTSRALKSSLVLSRSVVSTVLAVLTPTPPVSTDATPAVGRTGAADLNDAGSRDTAGSPPAYLAASEDKNGATSPLGGNQGGGCCC